MSDVEKDVDFLLWTKDNPSEPDKLIIGNISVLVQSHFKPDLPTKILIHGFGDTGTTGCAIKEFLFILHKSFFIRTRSAACKHV